GRESRCDCNWDGISAKSRALLESSELILRGGISKRIPFAAMRNVHGLQSDLSFRFDGASVTLRFPWPIAVSWAKRISSPPPALAKKLGISEGTAVLFQGAPSSEELQAALGIGNAASWSNCEVAVAEIHTTEQLDEVLRSATALRDGVSLWTVFRKGRGHAVSETLIRDTARQLGWRDSKVASVSSDWTGLRFVKKRFE
ncbi:MAG TPA: hypothetical protein VGD62_09720, partial [Acidobacteriaceae bacterium]